MDENCHLTVFYPNGFQRLKVGFNIHILVTSSAYLPLNVECLILADFPAQIESLLWRFNRSKSFLEGLVIVLIYYYVRSSFEIQADIFMSFESIWWAFRRVKYRKTYKNISKNNIFIIKSQKLATREGVKI